MKSDAKGRELRRLAEIVRNLEATVGDTTHIDDPRGGIDDCGEIGKPFALIGMIVDRVVGGRRIFEAEIAAEVASGNEILGAADRTTPLGIGRDRLVAAAIDADLAGVVEGARFGLDVDDAGGAQAVLCRQRAGDQRKIAYNAGVENLAERTDAIGQHDAIDAVLNIGVFVADMQITARRGVLTHARCLQQHSVERGILALRQGFDGLLCDLIGARAGWRQDGLASRIEMLVLLG